MRELNMEEIEAVDGGYDSGTAGYDGALAILAVTGAGALAGPVGWAVLSFAFGSAGGLALAQWMANNVH